MTTEQTPKLGFYKLDPSVSTPQYGTQDSACMDLEFNPIANDRIRWYSDLENEIGSDEIFNTADKNFTFRMWPDRVYMLPTGLIFDIPKGYAIKLYPRSSTCLKYSMELANQTGIIDSDFTDEAMILVRVKRPISIKAKTRLAQFELVKIIQPDCNIVTKKPQKKTDRSGGYGSTGT